MKLFISYRRADTQDLADHLYDRLSSEFGKQNVFRDVTTIQGGSDWRKEIKKGLRDCTALLVIIGKSWLTAANEEGKRRLDLPDDWVRFEIETALDWDVPVFPLLASDVKLPTASEMPDSLKSLTNFQSLPLRSGSEFEKDARNLIAALRGRRIGRRMIIAACLAGLLAMIGGLMMLNRPSLNDNHKLHANEIAKLEEIERRIETTKSESNDKIDTIFKGPPEFDFESLSAASLIIAGGSAPLTNKLVNKDNLDAANRRFVEASDQRKRAAKVRQAAFKNLRDTLDELANLDSTRELAESQEKIGNIRETLQHELGSLDINDIEKGKYNLHMELWWDEWHADYFAKWKSLDASIRQDILGLISNRKRNLMDLTKSSAVISK